MPFIFQGGDFDQGSVSPMEKFLVGLFGETAKGVTKSYEEAAQNKRLQMQLDAHNKQFEAQLAQRQQENDRTYGLQSAEEGRRADTYKRDATSRKSSAQFFSGMMGGGQPQGQGQAFGQNMQSPGGPAPSGGVGALGGAQPMPGLQAYAEAHQTRMPGLQSMLEGLDPKEQAQMMPIIMGLEETQKHQAHQNDFAQELEDALMHMQVQPQQPGMQQQGQGQQGPPAPGQQGPPAGGQGQQQAQYPTLDRAKQNHILHLQMAISALRSHDANADPIQLSQQLEQEQLAIDQLERQYLSHGSAVQADQVQLQSLIQKRDELIALDTQHPGAISRDHLAQLNDQIANLTHSATTFAANPGSDQKAHMEEWDKLSASPRSEIEGDKAAKDASIAIKHLQDQGEMLNKAMQSGALDPAVGGPQLQQIHNAVLKLMGFEPQQAPQGDTQVSEQTMGILNSAYASGPDILEKAIQRLGESGKIPPGTDIQALMEQVKKQGAASAASDEADVSAAIGGPSPTMKAANARMNAEKEKVSRAKEQFESKTHIQAPQSKEQYTLARETLMAAMEQEDKNATMTRRVGSKGDQPTQRISSESYRQMQTALRLLEAHARANGWHTPSREDLVSAAKAKKAERAAQPQVQ